MKTIYHYDSDKISGLIKKIVFFCFFIALTGLAEKGIANSVSISGTTVSADNKVRFTITWNNSWRRTVPPYNRDAVWIFIKYASCSGGTQVWKHAPLSTNASDDSTRTGAGPMEIVPALNADGTCKGVFLQRTSANAGGTAADSSNSNVGCRIQLAAGFPAGTYNFKVYAIEMVYIPQNDFQVGDGTSASTFNSRTVVVVDEISGNTTDSWFVTGLTTDVPAAYPVGWSSFYCMKYEISQEEYVDFLNVLTYDQQATRTIVAPNSAAGTGALVAVGTNRNGICIQTPGDATTTPKTPATYWCNLDGGSGNGAADGQNIACNYLSWADVSAFLDWSAMRPMSEMEFEKVCRGTAARVGAEYPWGTAALWQTGTAWECTAAGANIVLANSGNLSSGGQAAEASTASGTGLCAIGDIPFRVGFAATVSTTTRASAGTSYYGVLDMGGNLWERTVAVDATGLTFHRDSLGDGAIDSIATWQANVGTWPSVTTASGAGFRGGAWNTPCRLAGTSAEHQYRYIRTSDRTSATSANATTRASTYGGRGVRNP